MFRLVKNSTNPLTRVSGNPAGCISFVLSRGGGLSLNQDFVNLIHSLPERSFNLLANLGRSLVFVSCGKSFIGRPQIST